MFELLTRLTIVFVIALTLFIVMYASARIVGMAYNYTGAPQYSLTAFSLLLLSAVAFTVAILVGSFIHVRRR